MEIDKEYVERLLASPNLELTEERIDLQDERIQIETNVLKVIQEPNVKFLREISATIAENGDFNFEKCRVRLMTICRTF